MPNLKEFETLLEGELSEGSNGMKSAEAEKVVVAIVNVLGSLVDEDLPMMNGHSEEAVATIRERLVERVGEVVGGRIADSGHMTLAKAVLEA